MVERFRAAGRDCLQRYDASYRELGPSAPVRAEITVGGLRALLDALDRLDALAPLAEAAARVREAVAEREAAGAGHEESRRLLRSGAANQDSVSQAALAHARALRAEVAAVDALLALARGER